MGTYTSEHYMFHYDTGSQAERDISSIANYQEACFRHITNCLGIFPQEKIHYYFFNSREAVGREVEQQFGEYLPTNGCAVSGTEILAVYNDDIHCLGCHEDTHAISYHLCLPQSAFLAEGLACCMAQIWWGISNNAWTAYYMEKGACPSIVSLFSDTEFAQLSDMVSYPIAGAFVQYLLQRFGIKDFLHFYSDENGDFITAASTVFGCTLETLEDDFLHSIKLLSFDRTIFKRIGELLEDV